jgi:limonene-1,2-epoxide hydrolase
MALLKRKRSGQSDPMSVVTRFVNACNRHDADSVAACLHPEFDSIQPMFPARNFRGADQVRRNWQAIFDAEPGFRLTVLRQAASDDTVWLELHGAGRDAEVAGVFVMGILGDRVRWARIYSALIEPLPEGAEAEATSPATLREVPPLDEPGAAAVAAGGGDVAEDLIAPVLDIDGGGRSRRRRSSRRRSHDTDDIVAEPVAEADTPMASEPEVVVADDVAVAEPQAEPDPVPEVLVEPTTAEAAAEPEPVEAETAVVAEAAPEPDVVAPEPAAVAAASEPPAVVDAEPAAVEPVEPAAVEPAAVEAVEPTPAVVDVEPAPPPPADDTLVADIDWDDLTPEAPASSGAGSPATVSIEPDDDDVRPGKWLGRRRR